MRQETILGIKIDTCPTCAGIWFDVEELKRLQQMDELAFPALEDRFVPQIQSGPAKLDERRCPQCDALLTAYRYMYDSPIELDICDFCSGLWVEDKELHRMYQWCHAPLTTEEEQQIALARYQSEHDELMLRQENLRYFFSLLRRRLFRPLL
jgi:Zn-finger nucleic acid-binding protein